MEFDEDYAALLVNVDLHSDDGSSSRPEQVGCILSLSRDCVAFMVDVGLHSPVNDSLTDDVTWKLSRRRQITPY